MKKNIILFDLTSCEGCKNEFLRVFHDPTFHYIKEYFKIQSLNILTQKEKSSLFDIAFISGAPTSEKQIQSLKQIRKNSKNIIALGSCASIGGILSMPDQYKTEEFIRHIYGKRYTASFIVPKPISSYIKVDYNLSACPIDSLELKQLLTDIAHNKPLVTNDFSVCKECKLRGNKCLLLSGKPCLGPITQGGCKAICPSNKVSCYGCRGLRENVNFKAMIISLKKHGYHKKDIQKIFDLFLKDSDEYQKYLDGKIKIKININI